MGNPDAFIERAFNVDRPTRGQSDATLARVRAHTDEQVRSSRWQTSRQAAESEQAVLATRPSRRSHNVGPELDPATGDVRTDVPVAADVGGRRRIAAGAAGAAEAGSTGESLAWQNIAEQPTATAAVLHLHRAASAVRHHVEKEVLRPRQLTWTGFVVLRAVWAARRIETRHVAEQVGITKGTLTGVVDTLSGRELVRRDNHPNDGRRVLLQLTPKGQRLIRELLPESQRAEQFALSYLKPGELAAVTTALHGLVDHLERPR